MTMLLVADIGNTNTVLGLYRDKELTHKWSVQTSRQRTADEWGLTLKSLFEMAHLDLGDVTGGIIASVVPSAVYPLEHAFHKYRGIHPLQVGPGIKTGLILRYNNPTEIGADRIVNAVAARDNHKSACIIIDFGTATTYDALSASGEYLGGVICPGIAISLDALISNTAKLPRVALTPPPAIIGKTTEHAIQAGILHGHACMVDGLVDRLSAELSGPVTTIATGGLSPVIATISNTITHQYPHLTLDGLRILYERNASHSKQLVK